MFRIDPSFETPSPTLIRIKYGKVGGKPNKGERKKE